MKAKVKNKVAVKLELSEYEFDMIRIALGNVSPSDAADVGLFYGDFEDLSAQLDEVVV